MKDKTKLVSVITPMHNAEKYILETIQSVQSQTYENWEMIIIDNCSTDNSKAIVRDIDDDRIKLIELEYNSGGPARPRNLGIKHAKGEYVAFLDADDVLLSEKLTIQLEYMIENKYNFTSTNSINIDKDSRNIDKKYRLWSYLKKIKSKSTLCDLIKGNFIATSSVVVSKSVVSFFDENKDFIAVEDLCLWMKIMSTKGANYKYLDKKLLKYRILSTSTSERGENHKQGAKANLCILKFILDSQQFDNIKCFYIRIIKLAFIQFVKKILK